MFFNTSNSLRDMTNESFFPEVKLYDVRRTLGMNFSRHVLAKTATMLPQFLSWQVHKIIAEDVNRPGEL